MASAVNLHYNIGMQPMMRVTAVAGTAFLISLGTWAQSAAQPAFEVASVKASPPPTGNGPRSSALSGGPGTPDPGRLAGQNVSLRSLLLTAYGVRVDQLLAPDWMISTAYDVVATVPPDTTRAQAMLMLQNLLAERFKLVVHRETREMPIYALVVDKGGPKLTEAASDGPTNGGLSFTFSGAAMHMAADRMTMSNLTRFLSNDAGRPVIDETGLPGRYKISLDYQRDQLSTSAPEGPPGATLAAALQEQLGLKLESRKGPIEMLVVDRAEKTPTAN